MENQPDAQRSTKLTKPSMAAFVILLLLVVLAGVWNWPETAAPKVELRFAFNTYPGSLPPVLAEQLGYFRGDDCKITLIQDDEHADAIGRFASGEYAGIATTLGSAIMSSAVIPEARVVYVKDVSRGADVVLADPSIRSLADLRGKKVGAMIGDFGEFWLNRLLLRAGLSLDDVDVVLTTGSKVPDRIKAGEIVAGHSWSPYREVGLAQGLVEIATTASDPLVIVDVVLLRGDVLAAQPVCARHLLRGWSEAVTFWRRHPDEAVRLLKQALPHAPAASLAGIKIFDAQESAELMRSERLGELMREYVTFYRMRGGIVPDATLTRLIDRGPIEDLLLTERSP